MSLELFRAEACQALADANIGLNPNYKMPRAITEGVCWFQFMGAERASGSDFIASWELTIVLARGQNLDEALSRIEQLMQPVSDALEPIGYVDGATPTMLSSGQDTVPALVFQIRSEV